MWAAVQISIVERLAVQRSSGFFGLPQFVRCFQFFRVSIRKFWKRWEKSDILLSEVRKSAHISFFSQKLTSWVFDDQPCECAVVGHSRTIGRAAKIGWEKKVIAMSKKCKKETFFEIGTSIFFLSEFATKWPAQQDNFWKCMPFSSKMSELNG